MSIYSKDEVAIWLFFLRKVAIWLGSLTTHLLTIQYSKKIYRY